MLKAAKTKIIAKLTASLSDLDGQIRKCEADIAETTERKMRAQAEGDLSDNVDYRTSLEKLGQLNIKMMNLLNKKESWKEFSMVNNDVAPEYVGEGSCVLLEDEYSDRHTILIVPALLGNATLGAVSVASPVGKKILGKVKGDVIQVITPGGNPTYLIIDIY